MRYPTIPVRKTTRKAISRFRGLNRTARPGSGEFSHMENLSSDAWPVLSPRGVRGIWRKPAAPQGLIARDQLCYVDGADFVLGDTHIAMGLSVAPEDCPKTLVSMGAYVIILPDKMYLNTADPEDRGSMEVRKAVAGVRFALCSEDGTALEAPAGLQPPQEPQEGSLWQDIGAQPPVVKVYVQGQWQPREGVALCLEAQNIGTGFAQGDAITLADCENEALEGSFVLLLAEEDRLVLQGVQAQPFTQEGDLTLARTIPKMDHITQCGNRLWGCRYGPDENGRLVNTIYASKLGDFKNWNCFQGLSTDSYAASCGTAGPFTAAASFQGSPVFFKEDCVHKVYGSEPASFRIQVTPCRGVQAGCAGSLALVGERLFYRSREGICCYDGAGVSLLSQKLGRERCLQAAAGALGDKYYISQQRESGWELLVYDSARDCWHREDSLGCSAFCCLGDDLMAIDVASRNILSLTGRGEPEENVCWLAETGQLGLETAEQKTISRLTLSLRMEPGSKLEVLAQYDDAPQWQLLCTVFSTQLRTVRLPLRPRRCSFLRLRLQGQGAVKVYSITRIIEEGSDI